MDDDEQQRQAREEVAAWLDEASAALRALHERHLSDLAADARTDILEAKRTLTCAWWRNAMQLIVDYRRVQAKAPNDRVREAAFRAERFALFFAAVLRVALDNTPSKTEPSTPDLDADDMRVLNGADVETPMEAVASTGLLTLPPRPRLSALVAEVVAEETVTELVAQLKRLLAAFFVGRELRAHDVEQLRRLLRDPREYALETPIGTMVVNLTRYAQRGGEPAPLEGTIEVLQTIAFRAPIEPEPWRGFEHMETVDLSGPLGAVMVAATARFGLDHGGSASMRELALLAERDDHDVMLEFATHDERARIRSKQALRWLAKQKVAGFRTRQ